MSPKNIGEIFLEMQRREALLRAHNHFFTSLLQRQVVSSIAQLFYCWVKALSTHCL